MAQTKKMTSFNPHIFKAFYDWLLENDITPHLVVNADLPGVVVPREFVHQHVIILSISPLATRDFIIHSTGITFMARFHGVEQQVVVPFRSMQELFAVETSISYPIALWLADDQSQDETEQGAGIPDKDGEGVTSFSPLTTAGVREIPTAEDKVPSFTVLPPAADKEPK